MFVQDLPKLKESSLTASNASTLIDCQFYLALNRLLDCLGIFNEKKLIMSMSLMQKYDWSGVDARLIFSIPEYSNVNNDNVSGLAMLNRVIKDHKDINISDSSITIEYQVN